MTVWILHPRPDMLTALAVLALLQRGIQTKQQKWKVQSYNCGNKSCCACRIKRKRSANCTVLKKKKKKNPLVWNYKYILLAGCKDGPFKYLYTGLSGFSKLAGYKRMPGWVTFFQELHVCNEILSEQFTTRWVLLKFTANHFVVESMKPHSIPRDLKLG